MWRFLPVSVVVFQISSPSILILITRHLYGQRRLLIFQFKHEWTHGYMASWIRVQIKIDHSNGKLTSFFLFGQLSMPHPPAGFVNSCFFFCQHLKNSKTYLCSLNSCESHSQVGPGCWLTLWNILLYLMRRILATPKWESVRIWRGCNVRVLTHVHFRKLNTKISKNRISVTSFLRTAFLPLPLLYIIFHE